LTSTLVKKRREEVIYNSLYYPSRKREKREKGNITRLRESAGQSITA